MTNPERSPWFTPEPQPPRDTKRDTRRLPPPPKPTRSEATVSDPVLEAALNAFHALYGRIFKAAAQRPSLETPLPDLAGVSPENQTLLNELINKSAYLPAREPFPADEKEYHTFVGNVNQLDDKIVLKGLQRLPRDALEQLAVYFARQPMVELRETREKTTQAHSIEKTPAQETVEFAQKARHLIEDYERRLGEQRRGYESKAQQSEAQYRDQLDRLAKDFTRKRDALAAQKDAVVQENERLQARVSKAERLLADKTTEYARLEQIAATNPILQTLLAAKTDRVRELQERLSAYGAACTELETLAQKTQTPDAKKEGDAQ